MPLACSIERTPRSAAVPASVSWRCAATGIPRSRATPVMAPTVSGVSPRYTFSQSTPPLDQLTCCRARLLHRAERHRPAPLPTPGWRVAVEERAGRQDVVRCAPQIAYRGDAEL